MHQKRENWKVIDLDYNLISQLLVLLDVEVIQGEWSWHVITVHAPSVQFESIEDKLLFSFSIENAAGIIVLQIEIVNIIIKIGYNFINNYNKVGYLWL